MPCTRSPVPRVQPIERPLSKTKVHCLCGASQEITEQGNTPHNKGTVWIRSLREWSLFTPGGDGGNQGGGTRNYFWLMRGGHDIFLDEKWGGHEILIEKFGEKRGKRGGTRNF